MSILKYERRTPKTMQEMYDYLVDTNKTDSLHIFGLGVNPMYAVPEMEYVTSLYEAHNDLPAFRPLMWDFMKHYRLAEDGTRYYSESAFEEDDEIEIW